MPQISRTKTFEHTIAGLLTKRQQLMDASLQLREQIAKVGNDIEAIDRVLETLGFDGDLKGMAPRSNRVVFFHRNELRRFVMDELRKAKSPITSRELAEKIATAEGKDPRDRRLMCDMVKRVGKSLKLLNEQAFAQKIKNKTGIVWELRNGNAGQ